MDTIAIMAQKGGTGKTTTAQASAAGLKSRGARVLLIDGDPQGNLTYAMGAETARANLYSVLVEETTAQEAIQMIGSIGLITASPLLATLDLTLTQAGKEYRLKKALESIAGQFDYCIIDTPPALGIMTTSALTASNRAIITAQADIFSLQGIGALIPIIQAIRQHTNPGLTIEGILLTRHNPRTIISREILSMLEATARQMHTKVFTATIRENTAVKEAQATRQDIYTYDINSNAAADYKAFIDELMEEGGLTMAKKGLSSITNPAMAFITQEEQTAQQQPLKEKPSREDTAQGIAKNQLRPESKTKRLNLVLKPSTHRALEAIVKAKADPYTSINSLINDLLDQYIINNA